MPSHTWTKAHDTLYDTPRRLQWGGLYSVLYDNEYVNITSTSLQLQQGRRNLLLPFFPFSFSFFLSLLFPPPLSCRTPPQNPFRGFEAILHEIRSAHWAKKIKVRFLALTTWRSLHLFPINEDRAQIFSGRMTDDKMLSPRRPARSSKMQTRKSSPLKFMSLRFLSCPPYPQSCNRLHLLMNHHRWLDSPVEAPLPLVQ